MYIFAMEVKMKPLIFSQCDMEVKMKPLVYSQCDIEVKMKSLICSQCEMKMKITKGFFCLTVEVKLS